MKNNFSHAEKNGEGSRPGCRSARPRAERGGVERFVACGKFPASRRTARARFAAPGAGALPKSCLGISAALFFLAALTALATFSAAAQTNSSAANTDYAQFSRFVSDRNIFDPNRVPHSPRSTTTTRTKPRTKPRSGGMTGIALVGTMSYEKGWFAFFNAGDSDNKKVLAAGGEVGGNQVKAISATTVTLVGDDKKEFTMKIGDQLHQDGARWKLSENSATDSSSAAAATEPTTAAESDSASSSTETPAAAPAANLEGNNILKRLMEKRAKE